MHPLLDSALTELEGFEGSAQGQVGLAESFVAHLARHPDALWRHGPPEHLTASCLVLDPSGARVLLTHHRRGGFWAQLGGHCEPADTSLPMAALREAREESGLDQLRLLPGPIDLDRHELSAAFGRCRAHLDVRYVAVATSTRLPRVSAESLEVAWHDVTALPAGSVADLGRLIAAAHVRLGSLDTGAGERSRAGSAPQTVQGSAQVGP